MQIIYAKTPNLYIAIDEGTIFQIQRNHGRSINRHAIVVDALSATPFADWGIRDGLLYLDGLMISELAAWLIKEHRGAGWQTFGKQFIKLFKYGDEALLLETVKAVCRVVLNQTQGSAGEDGYFAREQWRQHPQEFAELMLARILLRSSNHKPAE